MATKQLLSDAERERVAQAVAAAEQHSGGEIATAIIAESDDYGFRELVFAIVVGFVAWTAAVAAAPGLSGILDRVFWAWEDWYLAVLQGAIGLIAGLVAYAVAQLPAVDRLIVSRRAMHEAVSRRARRHFMECGAYDTVDRTGVLIFVSALERRVELIADRGIHERVAPETWQIIVQDLTKGIRAGRTADALVEAVNACGQVLAKHVTRRSDDTNELPNQPDELERGS